MSGSEFPPVAVGNLWYVLDGKTILGPYSADAMRDMMRDRTIGPQTRLARAGESEWQTLGALTERASAASMAQRAVPAGYAGFWIRAGAIVLDAIIVNISVFVLSFVIFFVLGVVMAIKTGSGDMLNSWIAANKALLNLVTVAFWVPYETCFVGGNWQATPGKRICGIRVVRPSGERVGYGRALGRYLCYYLDAAIVLIGFMLAGWTKEKTALHDLLCDTRVVYGTTLPRTQAVTASF